ncbi:MAG: hypothetical protein AB7G06_00770 [Bdellovibrionales bacterium]
MNQKKGKRASEIKLIPIEKVNILNPRVRNQKVFHDIATNMTQVGLKRPITVTPCRSGAVGKRLLTRKADVASNRLLFVTEALRHLLKDDNFNTLLRAEGLTTFPKPLAGLMDEKGRRHG